MARYIVAGGFGIFGQAVVNLLVRQDHRVAVIDMAPVPDGFGGLGIGGTDLTDEAAVASAYEKAVVELGGLDGVVNVAGGFTWETLADGTLDSWDRMYRMNVRRRHPAAWRSAILARVAPSSMSAPRLRPARTWAWAPTPHRKPALPR